MLANLVECLEIVLGRQVATNGEDMSRRHSWIKFDIVPRTMPKETTIAEQVVDLIRMERIQPKFR